MENNKPNNMSNNANNISLSVNTREIIGCIASLDDIYNKVSSVCEGKKGEDIDALFEGTTEAFLSFKGKLESILASNIGDTMSASDYKEL